MSHDLAIIGAGAAGLATAIFAARTNPKASIALVEGAKKPGAKILVSGGGRCNVTNVVVTEKQFEGAAPHLVRRILSSFPAEQAVAFFAEIGVPLHEEEHGKLFPDSNTARTVLDALLRESGRLGVRRLDGHRVTAVKPGFVIETSMGPVEAKRVVLATGGKSLPKTGSDGAGYEFATSLGHSIVPTTPALAALLLDGTFHAPLSGIAHEVELTIRADGEKIRRMRGALLWTHFGASGPVVMDASRHWLRGKDATIHVNFVPGFDPDATLRVSATRAVLSILSQKIPARVAESIQKVCGIDARTTTAHLSREERRRLVTHLTEWKLPVVDSRGWNYAEVTAGGVPLSEVDPATLESRKCPGLYFVGEILDVDGRIGGFNFQWAWSTGWLAGKSAGADRV